MEEFRPKLDWRVLLQKFMENYDRTDYRWAPPNRRHVHSGLYLPGARNESLGEVVIAIDTSGSVSDRQLAEFQKNLKSICLLLAQTDQVDI